MKCFDNWLTKQGNIHLPAALQKTKQLQKKHVSEGSSFNRVEWNRKRVEWSQVEKSRAVQFEGTSKDINSNCLTISGLTRS